MANICIKDNTIYLTTSFESGIKLKFNITTEFNYSNVINLKQMTLLHINNKCMFMDVSLSNNTLYVQYNNKNMDFSMNTAYKLLYAETEHLILDYVELLRYLETCDLYEM